jgi:hypothetical protein
MVNFNRVHGTEIDQQPFGFIFLSGSPPQSGGFLHHGNWSGRTKPTSPQFQQAIEASGIGHCQPFNGLPSKPSGPISELESSYQAAFKKLAASLSGCLPMQKSD